MRAAPALVVLLALAAACGGGAAVPDGVTAPTAPTRAIAVRYAVGGPWVVNYVRADTLITTLPNGGQQRQVVERRLALRWQVAAAASGLTLTVTIDSARIFGLPGGGGARAMEDSARGSVIRGTLEPWGRLQGLTTTTDNTIARGLIADLPWLVPAFDPAGHSAAHWSDTLDVAVRFGVVDLAERTIRQSDVAPAADAVLVTLTGMVSRDGVSPQLRLTGGGMRQGTATIDRLGRVLQAAGRDSVAMTATVEAIGQSVPILQVGAYSLTPVP